MKVWVTFELYRLVRPSGSLVAPLIIRVYIITHQNPFREVIFELLSEVQVAATEYPYSQGLFVH
jgi:hypothetical protein